ncbi:DUF3617 domain-containing protein [Aliidiomarina sp. Khilg15.8]
MFKQLLIVGAFLLPVASASANNDFDIDLKPGLWEHSFTMESESGRMESAIEEALRQLERLPESQRRMVKNMMEKQGINLDMAGSSVEVCLSQDDLDQGTLPQQDGCEQELSQQDDDSYYFSFQCDGNPPHSGSGTMTIVDREHYRGESQFTTEMEGQTEHIRMRQEGRWLREDCNES